MEIIKAKLTDLQQIEPIFNLYRSFYGEEKNTEATLEFLEQRIKKNESMILFAKENEEILGFVQIFNSFSSATLSRTFILNDLYVIESARNRGIASALIAKVLEQAKMDNCSRVSLSTAKNNPAKKLYEKIGFRESKFKFYNYVL